MMTRTDAQSNPITFFCVPLSIDPPVTSQPAEILPQSRIEQQSSEWVRWLPLRIPEAYYSSCDARLGGTHSDYWVHCGVRRNACCVPFTVPTPTICPATLIATASTNSQPELAGIREFRSRIPLFAVQTNACDPAPAQLPCPTTVPRTLIEIARLQVPPARMPRSCTTPPLFHETA